MAEDGPIEEEEWDQEHKEVALGRIPVSERADKAVRHPGFAAHAHVSLVARDFPSFRAVSNREFS